MKSFGKKNFYYIVIVVIFFGQAKNGFACIDVEQEPDFNQTIEQKNDFLKKISIDRENSLVWKLRDYKPAYEKHIVVIIPSYKNSMRYKRNLDSIFMQKYENYHVIYIDDNSQDGTGFLVEKYVQEKKQSSRVTVIKNNERRYSLANIYTVVHMCDDNDIIATCDGDDYWCSDIVLETLNKIYQYFDIWLTYGSTIEVPGNNLLLRQPVPDDVIKKNLFRSSEWRYSGLRTFYAWLFKKINKNDLLFEGEFIKTHCDGTYFFPLLEMVGFKQQCIPDVFYVAHKATGINNFTNNKNTQTKMRMYVKNLAKYQLCNEFN